MCRWSKGSDAGRLWYQDEVREIRGIASPREKINKILVIHMELCVHIGELSQGKKMMSKLQVHPNVKMEN